MSDSVRSPGLGFETASWARRVLALVVDWLASTLVVIAVMGPDDYYGGSGGSVAVLGVFVLETAALTASLGGSFGQLATRLRVVRTDGGSGNVDPLRALVRQLLVALLVPPLIYRPDGRGLHDIAAGSATVTLQTFRLLSGPDDVV